MRIPFTRRPRALDDRAVEALLRGAAPAGSEDVGELATFLHEARTLLPPAPPAPSPELQHLLDAGCAPLASPAAPAAVGPGTRRQRRPFALATTALSLSVLGVLAVVASGNLPAPAQTLVADVVERLTPLTVPRPAVPATDEAPAPEQPAVEPVVPGPRPAPQPSATPHPPVLLLPVPSASPVPEPAPEQSPEPEDGAGTLDEESPDEQDPEESPDEQDPEESPDEQNPEEVPEEAPEDEGPDE